MTREERDKVLAAHKEWVDGKGGQRADLRGADLRGAYLRGAYLRGADLRGADLQRAYLQGADLQGADLQGADLRGANLRGADLQRADLQRADLQRADLQRADLRGADLQRADLRDAYLQGAYLRGAAHAWAQVAFNGHGECGRMLTAVIYEKDQDIIYQCGCFYGSADELRKYIDNGDQRLKASRMLAFETATKLLAK